MVHIQVGNKELRLSAVYKRLRTQIITSDIDSLLDTQGCVIIAGDLNAKHMTWSTRTNNITGNIIAGHLSNLRNITVAAPNTPNHYPDISSYHPHSLGIAILKTGNLIFTLENLQF